MRMTVCPACTLETRRFGRGRNYAIKPVEKAWRLNGDLRLFALTFAAGFMFTSLYLA
jgi:hypothetical protein